MGATLSDIHRQMYYDWRNDGLNHEQAIQKFPEHLRVRVEKELSMSAIESHFGVTPAWFFVSLVAALLLTLLIAWLC